MPVDGSRLGRRGRGGALTIGATDPETRLVIETVQVGRFGAVAFRQGADRWAVVLPGAGYTAQAPLLWYARFAALAAERDVLVVTEPFDRARDQPMQWVTDVTTATIDHVGGHDPRPLLIGKSVTSIAAPIAARDELPAIWLTPLIGDGAGAVAGHVITGLQAATRPCLLVGGTADDTWDGALAASLKQATVVELPGADHSLEVKGNLATSLAYLQHVANAMADFIGGLA